MMRYTNELRMKTETILPVSAYFLLPGFRIMPFRTQLWRNLGHFV